MCQLTTIMFPSIPIYLCHDEGCMAQQTTQTKSIACKLQGKYPQNCWCINFPATSNPTFNLAINYRLNHTPHAAFMQPLSKPYMASHVQSLLQFLRSWNCFLSSCVWLRKIPILELYLLRNPFWFRKIPISQLPLQIILSP